MKNIKIRTYGNQSLLLSIVERLKKLGARVTGFEDFAIRAHEGGTYGVYVDSVGRLSYASGDPEGSWFYQSGREIITLDELFDMTPEPKETIKIGDSTYDKAEFEKATENLKPIK
jgi:hypothetical protein